MSAPAPPTTPPPPSGTLEKRALAVTVLAVAIMLIYVALYLIPTHDPRPNGLEIGIVRPSAQVQRTRSQLRTAMPGLSIRSYASDASAARAVRTREIYGAIDLGGSRSVLTAPAASFQVAQMLKTIGMDLEIMRVTVLVPLPKGDSQGQVLNNLVLPLLITSMLVALLASQTIPELRTWDRIVFAGLIAAVVGVVAILFAKGIGALDGATLALAGWVALGVSALMLCSMAFLRLIGPPGVFVAFTLFLLLGNPGSGLPSAPRLLPAPWSIFGDFLPPAALGTGLRNTAYFDAHRTGGPLVVLLGWLLLGIALNLWADARTKDRSPAEATLAPTGQGAAVA